MDMGLENKRILVTGGSKGIGRAICEAFLSEGARVEFCARNEEQIDATEKALTGAGRVKGASVDVSDASSVADWVGAAAERMGGIDHVVSNASAFAVGGSVDAWTRGFTVDVLGTQALFDAALPHLVKAGAERGDAGMTVIASTAAAEAMFPNAYGAVKAALVHLVKGVARGHAPQNVRCNAVSPGTVYFEGGVWSAIEKNAPDMFKQTMARNPLGRMAAPRDIADAVVFLASPRSSFTTGANLVIDGALTQRVNF